MKAKMMAVMAAATLAFAGTAQADDAHPFTGFYVGGEFGTLNDSDYNEIYYAAALGARKQFDNNLVLGVEGTFGTADIKYLDHIWTVNGIVGYAFGSDSRNMIFAGVGYVEAQASAFGFTAKGGDVSTVLGYERALGNNWYARIKGNMYSDQTVTSTIGMGFRF